MVEAKNAVETAIKLGRSLGEVTDVNEVPAMLVPQGYEVKLFPDVEPELKRISARVKLDTVDSFCDFIQEHQTESSVIFVNADESSLAGIMDYHHGTTPEHCEFVVEHRAKHSDEWTEWTGSSKQPMSQWSFAEFLETNIDDIVEPSGAEILSCAMALEATKKADFSSSIRLNNGEIQLKYEETIQGNQKNNSISIPEEFSIGIPVYKYGDPYRIKARLRYRISDGDLKMWYELIKPEKTKDSAFDGIVAEIMAELDLPTYI